MLLLLTFKVDPDLFQRFEEYETRALAVLAGYGGEMVLRLRHLDSSGETHLLSVPDRDTLSAFLADPECVALQEAYADALPTPLVTKVAILESGQLPR
ncbi:hypothetical protein [Pseudooceanicola algae]|uniref:DUF1330 domain-containing protein n=1 Tax=Pseudooceanicola algae TaxID=1537215 RepID=A0A418SGB7_9RHOB|nr:hypothetical protein [Pseudooceanicola algae]QPM91581.1 hypothetical protein PSAL_028360 [Pseudooceanicola algae]